MSNTLTEAPESLQDASYTAEGIQLTQGQMDALHAFLAFLTDPLATTFVLEGYAGCGKSFLVKELLYRLPEYMETALLINPNQKEYEVLLTATTNKAAEALASITHQEVITIHSALSLRVQTDMKTGMTTLIPRNKTGIWNKLLFVDEAGYADSDLLDFIFKLTHDCKIVFIGDPAQLKPVKGVCTVFDAGFPGAKLTQVVRQAEGNPIIDLATAFRNTVNSGEFFSFTPDGEHIVYLDRDEFNASMLTEFSRPNWRYNDSKMLAWTNKTVNDYNHYIRDNVRGAPQLQKDDYAICNSFILLQSGKNIKTDQLVYISDDLGLTTSYGIIGRNLVLDRLHNVFLPDAFIDYDKTLKKARASNNWSMIRDIETSWIDLRAAYAQTLNKAQGSTYDKVYIDLDDIRKCKSGDAIARLLYVGVSRARNQVFLTGDIA